MSDTLDDLLDAIDNAVALMRARPAMRDSVDVDNLLRIRRILEEIDPAEIEAILEDEDEDEGENEEEE